LTGGVDWIPVTRSAVGSRSRDLLFEGVFWELMRCKNLLYRWLVQREAFQGHTYFQKFCGNLKTCKSQLSKHRLAISEADQNPSGLVHKGVLEIE